MHKGLLAALTAVAGLAATASADTILSFGFTDLSASFDTSTMVYSAVGVDTANLKTGGHVNRNISPAGSANYNPGTAAGLVSMTLDVANVAGNNATGSGSIFIEDADGDRFVADISGNFEMVAPAVFFTGHLTNIAFVPGPSTNNMFDGPSGGSFPLTFDPAQPPFVGAIVNLHFDTPGAFFSQNFQGRAAQVTGAVIPSPSSLALLGIGGLIAARRRR